MRTALELLYRDFAFSQRELLNAERFLALAQARDLPLTAERLEKLQVADLIRPLFVISRDEESLQRAVEAGASYLYEGARGTFSDRLALRDEHRAGRVSEGFNQVPTAATYRTHSLGRINDETSWCLFSPWQLLVLPDLLTELTWVERFPEQNADARRARLIQQHDLIVTLSTLEAVHWPQLSGVLRSSSREGFADFDQWRSSERAALELAWLGLRPECAEEAGLELCRAAHTHDPLREWFPLVASANARKRATLRGSALLAMERRQGAEILLRSAAEARGETTSQQMERLEPSRMFRTKRLVAPELESTLTSFGLSPHPSLVLVVEGAIDRLAFSQVFALLGIPERPDFIQLVDRHGVGQSLSALVDHVVVPRLGDIEPDGRVPVERPVTRMLVVTDPEGSMRTAAQRRDAISGWTSQVLDSIDPARRQPVRDRLAAELFEVLTWNDNGDCFEFAHFSDEQIGTAAALHDRRQRQQSAEEWTAILASIRAKQGSLNALFGNAQIQKRRVVAELLPGLATRIAQEDETVRWLDSDVPIVRAAGRAVQLATRFPRTSMGIRADPDGH